MQKDVPHFVPYGVPQKVSIVKWHSQNGSDQSRLLAIGSWGDEVNELVIRRFDIDLPVAKRGKPKLIKSKPPTAITDMEDEVKSLGHQSLTRDRLSGPLTSTKLDGDITDIQFLSSNALVASSSSGRVNLYGLTETESKSSLSKSEEDPSLSLSLLHEWTNETKSTSSSKAAKSLPLHQGVATSLDFQGDHIISAGEDGSIGILSVTSAQVVRMIDKVCPSTCFCIRFSCSGAHFFAACMGGSLLTFDPRASVIRPVQKCKDVAAECLTSLSVHPDRPNTAATGSAEGIVSVWDVRTNARPMCSVQQHSSTIWDVSFIPSAPTLLLTCCEDGTINVSDFNADGGDPIKVDYSTAQRSNFKSKVLGETGLGVNSIDVDPLTNSIVCGTDTEQLLILCRFDNSRG